MKRLLLATSVLALTASGAFAQGSPPSPAQSPAMPSPQSTMPNSENNMSPTQEEKADHATGQNHGTGTQDMEQTGQTPNSGVTGTSNNSQAAPMGDMAHTGHMDQVKQAQQALKDNGLYKGKVDGKMGPQTKSALSQFQKQNGLKQTAQLDHATMKALTQGGSSGGGSMGGSGMPAGGGSGMPAGESSGGNSMPGGTAPSGHTPGN